MSRSKAKNRIYMRAYMRQKRAGLLTPNVNTVEIAGDQVFSRPLEDLLTPNVNTGNPAEIDLEDALEYYEERAAVLEFDFGMRRQEAEAEARRRTVERFGCCRPASVARGAGDFMS